MLTIKRTDTGWVVEIGLIKEFYTDFLQMITRVIELENRIAIQK